MAVVVFVALSVLKGSKILKPRRLMQFQTSHPSYFLFETFQIDEFLGNFYLFQFQLADFSRKSHLPSYTESRQCDRGVTIITASTYYYYYYFTIRVGGR